MKENGNVAYIQLVGEPYQRRVLGRDGVEEVDCNKTLNVLAQSTDYRARLPHLLEETKPHLEVLTKGDGYYEIDNRIKKGENLSFEEAFSLGTFVCSALNRPLREAVAATQDLPPYDTHLLQATALLSAMSAKEVYASLTADEIAGMVAATLQLDTVVRSEYKDPLLAFGGMGGDKGYPMNGKRTKLFSLSTLSTLALGVDGPVHKHHSYPNTSKVAGQSAIEAVGARSDFQTQEATEGVIQDSNILMTSCHDTRTLHTLSHRLRGETINHVIGPLAFTIDSTVAIHPFIGVNEKIAPEAIIEAMKILNIKGIQRYENGAVYCGTDLQDRVAFSEDNDFLREHVMLDEVAPPPYISLVAFLVRGENYGTYMLAPEDFYTPDELRKIHFSDLVIPNEREHILFHNMQALSAKDQAKARYLAMTIGLGLFVRYGLYRQDALDRESKQVNKVYLREYTQEALAILESGDAVRKLEEYVSVTNEYAGER